MFTECCPLSCFTNAEYDESRGLGLTATFCKVNSPEYERYVMSAVPVVHVGSGMSYISGYFSLRLFLDIYKVQVKPDARLDKQQ